MAEIDIKINEEEKAVVEQTLANNRRSKEEGALISRFEKEKVGDCTPELFSELKAHPKFDELRKQLGFRPDTAPFIVAETMKAIQNANKSAEQKKKEEADRIEAERLAAIEKQKREATAGGGGGAAETDKDPDPRTLDLSHLPVCVRGKLIKEWDARNGSRK